MNRRFCDVCEHAIDNDEPSTIPLPDVRIGETGNVPMKLRLRVEGGICGTGFYCLDYCQKCIEKLVRTALETADHG